MSKQAKLAQFASFVRGKNYEKMFEHKFENKFIMWNLVLS